MTQDAKRDREVCGDVDVHGIAVAPNGRIAITGVMRAKMKWTKDAVHQAYTERTHEGRWKNNVGPDELFLAVFDADFKKISYVSGFSQNGLYEPRGKGAGVAVTDQAVAVVGQIASPPSADDGASWYCFHFATAGPSRRRQRRLRGDLAAQRGWQRYLGRTLPNGHRPLGR